MSASTSRQYWIAVITEQDANGKTLNAKHVVSPSSSSQLHPVFTPRAVARSGSWGCCRDGDPRRPGGAVMVGVCLALVTRHRRLVSVPSSFPAHEQGSRPWCVVLCRLDAVRAPSRPRPSHCRFFPSSRGHDSHDGGGNSSPRRRYRFVNSRCHRSSSFGW